MQIGRLVFQNTFSKLQSIRQISTTYKVMAPIKVGEKLPSVDLFEDSPANKINTGDLTSGKKVVIFGVPGAFTPGCSKTHLPGYVSSADSLKSQQKVDEIVCVSVNDPFVMSAWGKEHNAAGKVRMLADPSAAFAKALDLTIDLPPLGGVRAKRFSMVVENGQVVELNVEPDGTGLSCSLANNLGKK
ncbi:peroxiredoxin-5, mitochondrial-like [Musca domestica]|uniref:Peroxiredoxin-5 n=1 Tax=Musca domestica TaxID=7370 RepID=A0A1I8NES2_MUSDO|nr:peroxiredoxin-5, mitochondrial [Musca domestica]XP_058974228.1 peroxiredoxin-5, mitochondrial-like [Musca domestica]